MIIQNKGDFVRHIGVRLIPGTNHLNAAEIIAFKEALENPLNKTVIESDEFVVPDGLLEEEQSIRSIKAWQKAVELVEDTHDLALLAKFKEDEGASGNPRPVVVTAIEERIEYIKNPPDEDRVKDKEDAE
ncbi:hypothetical protein HCA69_02315 [Listeria grandensis]|uniref:Uncharacterized protein n=1 Tax=Listeria grandensis TaxID=1494963 RepID=A0A7X1CNQ8_9LIST|nr:hypothetical protein [Listeria grandensis]MBC1935184.1 hypothetical protein [Listeria grandensis]